VGWYASIYSLASSAFQPITGRIYSKFNIKYSFLAFFAIFEAGSLICGTSISSGMFIIGRAVAGAGSSGFINGAVTILAATVPLEKRPSLTGIMMGFSQLGIVLGPLVGGAFTSYTTWRWCFYVNLPVGAIVAIGLMLVDIPDLVTKPKPFDVLRRLHVELDLVGFTLIAPAAVMLLLATQWGGDPYAWNSPTIIGLFCGAGASAVVWFVWNFYHGEDALIPMSILRINATWSSAFTQGFLLTGVYCASFYLPMYFQAVKGVVPMMSGVYLIASIGSQLLSAVVAGMLGKWLILQVFFFSTHANCYHS
jgi:Arabinose efflux permease